MADAETSTLLSSQIQTLSDLQSRLQSLRHIPRVLLRPPHIPAVIPSSAPNLRPQFQQLDDIVQLLRSSPTQLALRSANDRLLTDSSDLAPYSRRENKNHVHNVPDSPQPYLPPEVDKIPPFPRDSSTYESVTSDNLVDYIRDFNRKHHSKLQVWVNAPKQNILEPPITLRFSIPNVLCALLSLNYCQSDTRLIVETISIYGPREKKTPQTQSDFTVYQCLSQHMGKMLQLQAQSALQSILELLESYDGLFIEKCTVCERVLSAEGHIPPVVRVWTANEKGPASGKWQPMHIMCQQGS